MKLQLFVTLFVYFVYHCSFAKVADGPDEFCDEGPPGNYCLPDLTGWHNCYVDRKTGQMVDKITTCPPNTRCVTFWFTESKCQGSWRTGRRLSNGGSGGGGGGGEVGVQRIFGGGSHGYRGELRWGEGGQQSSSTEYKGGTVKNCPPIRRAVEYYRASGGGGGTLPKWMVQNILTRSVFGLSSFPKARKSDFCPALVMKKYFF